MSIAATKLAATLEHSAGVPTDVTIYINEGDAGVKEFYAHKYYLALVSEVFKALFFGPLRETKDAIEVKGVTVEALATMINYIYHRRCGWSHCLIGSLILYFKLPGK